MTIWRRIHDALRDEIASGTYRAGDKLPTEQQLADRFGVNRHTVRRALAEMVSENAIYVRRGSGAYVSEGMVDYRLGPGVKFSQNIRELGRTPAHRLLGSERRAPSEREARHLELRPGAEVVSLETLGEVDGAPIIHCLHVFPHARFPELARAFVETGSITVALRRYGVVDYRRAWTRVTARAPSRAMAETLRQAQATPVLFSEGVNLDMAGQPIEYGAAHWAGGRAQFMVD